MKETRDRVCSHCFMQLAAVWLYRFNGLIQSATISRKGGVLQNKNGTRASCACEALHHDSFAAANSCVAEACDDGLQRIAVCLRCDPALRVAGGD